MTKELFAETEILSEKPLPQKELWCVLAYHAQGNYWKVWPLFDGRGEAIAEAERLYECWTHRRILRVTVP